MKNRKANARCLTCGRLGHWRVDPECPMRGTVVNKGKSKKGCGKRKGAKKGGFFAAIIGAALSLFLIFTEPRDILQAEKRAQIMRAEAYVNDDSVAYWIAGEYPYAIADSGCNSSVAGRDWLEAYKSTIAVHALQPTIEIHHEVFNGLGGAQCESFRRWHL